MTKKRSTGNNIAQNKKPGNGKNGQSRNQPARGNKKVVEIFTASFCPHCQDAKFYMKRRGIKYIEYNLERSKEAEKKFRGYGGKAIPLIIVNSKLLRRWDQQAFEKLFEG